ncbi:hypothetical protein [uncultured Chitinophaga sp.]|uniref:DUF7003 family protein n=1 Tax=uncultured Chitinophaga sp. TaxID=339340 RepID=UPI0025E37100|nr:hypothetical protein [uncultured Chitinophaga sp.]
MKKTLLPKEIITAIRDAQKTEGIKPMQLLEMKEHLLSSRMSLFSDGHKNWAMVLEKLICLNDESVELQIIFYGNCYEVPIHQRHSDYSNVMLDYPMDTEQFFSTMEEEGGLLDTASYWVVREKEVPLQRNIEEIKAGNPFADDEVLWPLDQLHYQTVGSKSLFHASVSDLQSCLPNDLPLVLVVEDWLHHDPYHHLVLDDSDNELLGVFSDDKCSNMILTNNLVDQYYDGGISIMRFNAPGWDAGRDATLQMFAKVLATGRPEFYKAGNYSNSDGLSRQGGIVGCLVEDLPPITSLRHARQGGITTISLGSIMTQFNLGFG